MRIVSIGDIGVQSDMIHIGDEAMFEALVDELGSRGIEVTGLSSAPDESAARYGIRAVQRIGFDLARGRAAAHDRMDAVVALAHGGSGSRTSLASDDPAHAVVAAITESDGVVVAGGGNLASTWPMHVFERVTLAAVAGALGKPFVITGQTLGPALSGDDRDLVATMLAAARLVGVREGASFALAQKLGVDDARLARNVDDASFLGRGATSAHPDAVVVSLSTHLGAVPRDVAVPSVARLLDSIAAMSGAPVVFHAHWASLRYGQIRGDSPLHEEVRAAMTTSSSVAPTTDSAASAALARGAALQVTSRYHPAVFAASAGTPTLAISVDDYTGVKLRGALGVGDPVAIEDVVAGRAEETAAALWRDRDAWRTSASERAESARVSATAWWDLLADTLHRP